MDIIVFLMIDSDMAYDLPVIRLISCEIHDLNNHQRQRNRDNFLVKLCLTNIWNLMIVLGIAGYLHYKHIEAEANVPPFRRRHFQMHFLDWKCMNLIKIPLKFVPRAPINNIPALVWIMAWRRSGTKPLSEPVMLSLLTHICVTRSRWAIATWLSDAIWRHKSVLTMPHVMACCMIAPSHYLKQYWLIIINPPLYLHISELVQHSPYTCHGIVANIKGVHQISVVMLWEVFQSRF